MEAYDQALAEQNVCDFDDLLLHVYHQLSADDKARRKIQATYRAILVDEFQDTNELQYELLKLLNSTDNLFVIGDPRQSIYGFRGAHAGVFDRFHADWPDALQVTLTVNYRSAPEIVRLSGSIFPDAPALAAHNQTPGQVRCVEVLNEYSEAQWIIAAIEQHIGGSTMLRGHDHHDQAARAATFRDFAVLYRTHAVAKTVKKLLDESGIPYQVAGEGSPYQRPDVQTVLGGLGYLAGGDLPELPGLTEGQSLAVLEPLKSNDQTTSQLISTLAHKLGYPLEGAFLQFLNAASRFDQSIAAYLAHIQSIADQDFYDPEATAVTLMTIHASKGLEFPHVFLIGAEDSLLPHHSPKRPADLDKEKRLFYVAVTRAAQNLDILHTRTRAGQPATLSPFVSVLPKDVLPHITDPALTDHQRRAQKRRLKRSQTSLF